MGLLTHFAKVRRPIRPPRSALVLVGGRVFILKASLEGGAFLLGELGELFLGREEVVE